MSTSMRLTTIKAPLPNTSTSAAAKSNFDLSKASRVSIAQVRTGQLNTANQYVGVSFEMPSMAKYQAYLLNKISKSRESSSTAPALAFIIN